MRIVEKINHNAVLVDDLGIEKIILGKDIGFSVQPNDTFNNVPENRVFIFDSEKQRESFIKIANQIPLEYIEFCDEIILYIAASLKRKLNTNIYIALTDHIYFAIQRAGNKNISSAAIPELEACYPEEFQVSKTVIEMLNKKFQTHLTPNEAGFITIHIVNAELGERTNFNSLRIIEVTKFILNFLVEHDAIEVDTESFAYQRLTLHVRCWVQRLLYHQRSSAIDDSMFSNSLKQQNEYELVSDISRQLADKYQLQVSETQKLSMTNYLLRRSNNNHVYM